MSLFQIVILFNHKLSTGTQRNEEIDKTIIEGIGEPHFVIVIDRMKRGFSTDATIGDSFMSYRDVITKTVDIDFTHTK